MKGKIFVRLPKRKLPTQPIVIGVGLGTALAVATFAGYILFVRARERNQRRSVPRE